MSTPKTVWHSDTEYLTADDHTQYALLAGRSGGQTLTGGTAAADDLILKATSGVGAGSEAIIFQVGSNGSIEAARFVQANSVGRLIIGSADGFNSGSQFELVRENDNSAVFRATTYGAGDIASIMQAIRGGGTLASPTAVQSGDKLAALPQVFGQYDTTPGHVTQTAEILVSATEAFTASAAGSKIEFYNTPNGSATRAVRLSIEQDGAVAVKAAAGYLDLSAISAGNKNIKITATSDTPTVAWNTSGARVPSTTPAGYIEIDVGGNARYIPFWA